MRIIHIPLVLGLLLAGLACLSYISGQEPKAPAEESLESLRGRAEKGDVAAQVQLGVIYYNGQGVPQDYAEAVRWYRKAADQGDAIAQTYLGVVNEQGRGVLRDYVEAVRWYRKAAEQGFADAQSALGVMYEMGRGAPQDNVEAHMWMNLAAARARDAEQGEYARSRDSLGQQMNPQEIAEAQRRAREWMLKAGTTPASESLRSLRARADAGDATAQSDLGLMYEMGIEVLQDYVEAHMWMNLAAARANGKLRASVVNLRDELFGKMTPDQIAEAQRRAREWKPKIAQQPKAPLSKTPTKK